MRNHFNNGLFLTTLLTFVWACPAPPTDMPQDMETPSDVSPDIPEDTSPDISDASLDVSPDLPPDASADATADMVEDMETDVTEDMPRDLRDMSPDALGALLGMCDVLEEMDLTSPDPQLLKNILDFGTDPYDAQDEPRLTPGAQRVLNDPNAGGSSIFSEVFSFEVLARCEAAALLKTETQIEYVPNPASITDLLVEIDGLKVGVSVTRAYRGPMGKPDAADATRLLTKKLGDIQDSTRDVLEADRWTKQILHILAYSPEFADTFETAYQGLSIDLKADTIVIITVTNGEDEVVYTNRLEP